MELSVISVLVSSTLNCKNGGIQPIGIVLDSDPHSADPWVEVSSAFNSAIEVLMSKASLST